jgi:hypothetical protein
MTTTKPPFWQAFVDHEAALDAARAARYTAPAPAPVPAPPASRWEPFIALLTLLRLLGGMVRR